MLIGNLVAQKIYESQIIMDRRDKNSNVRVKSKVEKNLQNAVQNSTFE